MDKIVQGDSRGHFYSSIMNVLIKNKHFEKIFNCKECAVQCFFYELGTQSSETILLIDKLLNWVQGGVKELLETILNLLHTHCEHQGIGCLDTCILHSDLCITGTFEYSCKSSHRFVVKAEYYPWYFIEVEIMKFFRPAPDMIKHLTDPSESLVCSYSGKLVSMYNNLNVFKCQDSSCFNSSSLEIKLKNLIKTLVFQALYDKPLIELNELDNLRCVASFPNNFKSNLLFVSDSIENYTIVGFVLRSENSYGSLTYNSTNRNWEYIKRGEIYKGSKFEIILQMIFDNYFIESAVYMLGNNKHEELTDNAWIFFENKVCSKYTLNGKIEGMIANPCLNRYWTCGGCRRIIFNQRGCRCGKTFEISFLGWNCFCTKKIVDQECRCGTFLQLCRICELFYVRVKGQNCLPCCDKCKIWKCIICKSENVYPLVSCARCSNPCLLISKLIK